MCSCIALSCAVKNMCNVPSRREKLYAPSRPVEQKINTVPSRRDNFYLPSRPVTKQREVTVLYRPVPSRKFTPPTVPSHPGNYNFHYFTVPSRSIFNFFPAKTCQNSTVPSRILSAMESLGENRHTASSSVTHVVEVTAKRRLLLITSVTPISSLKIV